MKNYSFEFDEYGVKLFEVIKKYDYLESIDYLTIQKAFDLAKRYHEGQNRKSGDPYYSHPVAVAGIVAEYDCSTDMICAALLHDTVEDTSNNLVKIRFMFNDTVADIVDGVTNIDILYIRKISFDTNIYKISIYKKSLILKLCDRLHNTRTMKHMAKKKIKQKVEENLRSFIPLARSEKMFAVAKELEILCKQLLH